MRFSQVAAGLALPGVSLAQMFTNSSTPVSTPSATSSSASPSGTAGPKTVDLSAAILVNAEFTTIDGKTAIILQAPANGEASFSVPADVPEGVDIGDIISAIADIFSDANASRKRAVQTDCTLSIDLSGANVYDEVLLTTDGAFTPIASSGTPANAAPQLVVTETCGDNPVSVTVANVALEAGADPSTPSLTASVTDTLTPTSSATGTVTRTGSVSRTTLSPSSSATSDAGFPSPIDNFAFYGCVGSSAGFPTFDLVDSTERMTLDLCATQCKGKAAFGVFGEDCYCGDDVDEIQTSRVDEESCNIICPGDNDEFCGGAPLLARRGRLDARQNVPNSILLTVYVAFFAPPTTVTTETTITTTYATTVGTATTTVTQVLSCNTGACAPVATHSAGDWYVFEPVNGSDCAGQLVYVTQPCSCAGGVSYIPKKCTDDSCNGVTVYKPNTANGSDHEVVYSAGVCSGNECSTAGVIVYKPTEGSAATGTAGAGAAPTAGSGSGSGSSGNTGSGSGSGSGSGAGSPAGSGTTGSGSGSGSPAGSGSGSTTGSTTGSTPAVVVNGAAEKAVSMISLIAALAVAFA